MTNSLFCFGFGYCAARLAASLSPDQWQIGGTVRQKNGGPATHRFGDDLALDGVTHLLLSIPPDENGDPALQRYRDAITAAKSLRWIGYLSTTGVYGDHGGGWVDETTPTAPTSARARRRASAERDWLALGAALGVQTQVFRLAGIYGPGRSVLDDIRHGTARRIVKPNQLFSRIHVDDIGQILRAAMSGRSAASIFNICDDEPAAPSEVVAYGCRLLGVAPPPEIAFEAAGLSPMALTFWADNKRVDNRLMKRELAVELLYPSYREGLAALLTSSSAGI